jgi:hypothetical protein
MNTPIVAPVRALYRPLASLVTAACCLAWTAPLAASASSSDSPQLTSTLVVTNCNDHGAGSLRDAVALAGNGDTIDLTQTGCSTIALEGEPIAIVQDDLNIVGPGRPGMLLDGGDRSSLFRHAGTGTLSITGVAMAYGVNAEAGPDGSIEGGCIYSAGSVHIVRSSVRDCTAYTAKDTSAFGAGIYAAGNATIIDSSIFDNAIRVSREPKKRIYSSSGAGLYVNGNLRLEYSRIVTNGGRYGSAGDGAVARGNITSIYSVVAGNTGRGLSVGTGLSNDASMTLMNSTISGNKNGGLSAINGSVTLVDSTVSGNSSAPDNGYSAVIAGPLTISNSTIAYNKIASPANVCDDQAAILSASFGPDGPGISLHLDSSIIANNTCNGQPGTDVLAWTSDTLVVTGANNLVMSAPEVILPADTIAADPRLSPLAYHGSGRMTHALLADSPAIDGGNNAAGLAWDERGKGFPRTKGAATDIGAFEY